MFVHGRGSGAAIIVAFLLVAAACTEIPGLGRYRDSPSDGGVPLVDDGGVSPVPDGTPTTNKAPGVDAGSDGSVLLSAAFALDGTISDDELPNPPGTVTTTWSKVSGPGDVEFGDSSSLDTTVMFSQPGAYVLRLEANDGGFAASDSVTITVTPDHAGAVHYVSLSGNDENAGTDNAPFRTIAKGVTVLGAGDTLYIRAGTYAEELNEYRVDIPSGSSWAAPVTIAAFPGERVVVRPNAGANVTDVLRLMGTMYVVFKDLVLDGTNVVHNVVKITYTGPDPARSARHIRLLNCEIMNGPLMGILGCREGCEFIGLKIHDNGTTDFHHGIYVGGNNILVEGCDIYRNAVWGIHKYSTGDNWIIRNNLVHDNARVGDRGVGIGLYGGRNNLVYNNLVWGNKGGLVARYGESEARIYNNTVYDNAIVGIDNDAPNSTFQNNILYQNERPMDDRASGTTASHNLTSDPRFVSTDSTHPDFLKLSSGSPAIDNGVSATEVRDDITGTPRPQRAGFDIGAYEHPLP